MAKVRVYQLAKELNVQSALILELLDRMGQEVKSDLSTLDGAVAAVVREKVSAALNAEKRRLEVARRQAEAEAAERAATAAPEPAAETPATTPPAAPAEEPAEEPAVPAAASEPAPHVEKPAAAPPAAARTPASPTPAPAAATTAAAGKPDAPLLPGQKRKPRVFAAKRTTPITTVRFKKEPARPPGRGAGANYAPPGSGPYARTGRPGSGGKRKRKKKMDVAERNAAPMSSKPRADLPPVPEQISLSEAVTVKELAEKLNRKSKDVIAKLIPRGVLATINQPLDPEMAIDVAKDFGSTATILSFEEEAQLKSAPAATAEADEIALPEVEVEGEAIERPPVVTVMGHVDHGKTSLLDAIRKANVVDREAGGITQHIGAYQVEERGKKITFLDTPGHEAFTLMRARGAKATDIVVLVVAADDGVKPQTIEAIDHAKAAGTPIIVAINKIDKPDSTPDRVKQQLTEHELIVEDYGGDVISCEVSAKQATGLDNLLELILLVAEVQEYRANPQRPAGGVVLEAKLDRARGVVATVLVQDGTLHAGDPFIVGSTYGKVRAMTDQHGKRIKQAGPSTPVEIIGLDEEPGAGDTFQAVGDEAKARQIAGFRRQKEREAAMQRSARRSLLDLSREIAEGGIKELPLLLKTDVQGSIEALQKAISDLPSDKVRVNVLRTSTGAVTQADVLLAAASNAIIVGFNVRPDRGAADLADKEEIEIRTYTVIYDVINDLKQAMLGLLEPTFREEVLGQAEVRDLFKVPKVGIVCGCYVTEGKVTRNAEIRLLRDNVVIHTGKVGSLRRFKDDTAEVKQGYECGIGIENYNDCKLGDVIEFFRMQEVAAESL